MRREWLFVGALLGFGASTLAGQGVPGFSDQTAASGIDCFYSPGFFVHQNYAGGGAAGDFNRDGWQDLFLVTGGEQGIPDKLYINNGDGTFTDQAAAWGLTTVHRGKGASVGDINGDGWLDLYVTSAGPDATPGNHKLYRNNGDGTFTDIAVSAGVNYSHPTSEDGFGSCFGDYDLDGDLDLFVAGFRNFNDGNRLFRNNGDETFTEVTAAAGLFVGDPIDHHGFAPSFIDFDGDRYPELCLVSDFGTSTYFKNNTDGTFTPWAAEAGVAQEENGMGQCAADFDRDGLLDWYVASIYRPSIGWTGNKLYLNQGDGTFEEVAAAAGVDDGGYGWGSVGRDFDHDGWVDIAETNGGLGTEFTSEQSYLWLNDGDGTYTESAVALGLVHDLQGRGLIAFDHDNDGDQDLVICTNYGNVMLFRNDLSGTDIHWLRVFLDATGVDAVAPDGFGSKVYATVGSVVHLASLDGGDAFCSKSELSAHFGLGAATIVDLLRVEWPDGQITELSDVAVDQTLVISRSAQTPFRRGDVNGDGAVNIADPIALLGNLFEGLTTVTCAVAADANGDGGTDIADAVFLLSYSFSSGMAPPAPFPDCGTEPGTYECASGGCP